MALSSGVAPARGSTKTCSPCAPELAPQFVAHVAAGVVDRAPEAPLPVEVMPPVPHAANWSIDPTAINSVSQRHRGVR